MLRIFIFFPTTKLQLEINNTVDSVEIQFQTVDNSLLVDNICDSQNLWSNIFILYIVNVYN